MEERECPYGLQRTSRRQGTRIAIEIDCLMGYDAESVLCQQPALLP